MFIEPETGAVLNDRWWPGDEETVRKELAEATEKAKTLQSLVRRAEKDPGDQRLQAELKIRLALMHAAQASLDELAQLARTPDLDPELKREFELWYAGRRVQKVLDDAQEEAESREEFDAAIQAGFYALLKEGVRLPPDHDLAQLYYGQGLDAAVAKGDRDVAKKAYEGFSETLEALRSAHPQLADKIQEALDDAKERLEGIKE